MKSSRSILVLLPAALLVLASWRLNLRAQERGVRPQNPASPAPPARTKAAEPARPGAPPASVGDALLRPFTMPFGEPTSLQDVCRHLHATLKAPVVLDLAALGRKKVSPQDKIQLDLTGARLKTGLKLLLDQVGLTYRVVPEDNLLIVTDSEGADDPYERILSELEALHRDVHDLQDAVEELRGSIVIEEEAPTMQQPTIIEELPAGPGDNPEAPPATSGPGRARPGL